MQQKARMSGQEYCGHTEWQIDALLFHTPEFSQLRLLVPLLSLWAIETPQPSARLSAELMVAVRPGSLLLAVPGFGEGEPQKLDQAFRFVELEQLLSYPGLSSGE
jgi:hypothetical protein